MTAVLNKHGECQPLMELNNSFCGQNRIRLDKYVNVDVYSQQSMNDRLWSLQKQYEFVYPKESISKECIHNFKFFACNIMFPGCDRSTSEFKLKKFCKQSCIHFIKECSKFARFWKYVASTTDSVAALMTVFNYSVNPSRNAGDSPECLYYVENGDFAEEGMTLLDLPSCILRLDTSGRKSFS